MAEGGQRAPARRSRCQRRGPPSPCSRPAPPSSARARRRAAARPGPREQQRDAAGVSLLDVLHHAAVGLVGMRVVEHRHVLVGHLRAGRRRRAAARRTADPPAAVWATWPSGSTHSSRVLHPLGARPAARSAAAGSAAAAAARTAPARPGPVAQLVVRREQRDLHRVTRERRRRSSALDRGDATSADDHPEAVHRASVPGAGKHRTEPGGSPDARSPRRRDD